MNPVRVTELRPEVESLLAAREDGAGDFLSPQDLSAQIADLKPTSAVQRVLGITRFSE